MRALLLLILLVAAGCDTSGPEANARTDDAQIRLGDTAVVDGLTITFEEVAEDSRCPQNVICVWPGMALVDLVIEGEPYQLLVTAPEAAPDAGVRFGDRVVFAVDLTPYPVEGDEQPASEHVVEIVTVEA